MLKAKARKNMFSQGKVLLSAKAPWRAGICIPRGLMAQTDQRGLGHQSMKQKVTQKVIARRCGRINAALPFKEITA
ncbi:MAG: hypothetical protein R6W75_08315 [Smithellaceae bacterium]